MDVRQSGNTQHTFTLENLEPATTYEVYISAENMIGQGIPLRQEIETVKMPEGKISLQQITDKFELTSNNFMPKHVSFFFAKCSAHAWAIYIVT